VEFRGFVPDLLQLGHLRAHLNPQIEKFPIHFFRPPRGARQSFDALPDFTLGAGQQLPAMPGSVESHRNSPITDARKIPIFLVMEFRPRFTRDWRSLEFHPAAF
jgi:hypothetical protein